MTWFQDLLNALKALLSFAAGFLAHVQMVKAEKSQAETKIYQEVAEDEKIRADVAAGNVPDSVQKYYVD